MALLNIRMRIANAKKLEDNLWEISLDCEDNPQIRGIFQVVEKVKEQKLRKELEQALEDALIRFDIVQSII